MDNIIDSLNDRQKEAVLNTEGALLVLAGAGSGKTRVITHRFAYLLKDKNITIQNILAVTFTNKAAGEMKERITALSGLNASNAWVRTFHSTGVLILRRFSEAAGYPGDFVIYDDGDSKSLVKSIMKELGISPKTFNPSGISDRISKLKDSMITPQEFAKAVSSDFDSAVLPVYSQYEKLLRKNRAVDFPDLISLPIRILSENERILSYYHSLWHYVMVDEFQDTNSAQYELIRLFCPPSGNICAVGDDDQSIYGWRGANIDNIYDFRDRFNAKVIMLEQNYRSTGVILSAAHAVVEKIRGRMDKKLWTSRKPGEKITIIEAVTDRNEARMIADTIDRLLSEYNYRDFALFYRTNAQSRLLEEELLFHNIPYRVFGGQKFYARKEVKDILAYIKLIINPFDGTSFERIVNVPKRKIGEATLRKIMKSADKQNISYIETLLSEGGDDIKLSVPMKELGVILHEMRSSIETQTPVNFVKILIESIGYKDYLVNYDEDGLDRWSNVEELINSISEYENSNPDLKISDYINDITLRTDSDDIGSDERRDYVSLMTMHNAKGLEFSVVFISGVVSGLIPHSSSIYSDAEFNEERRLFYVGITRAKDRLYLSMSETRLIYGEVERCIASPFLKDIPEEFIERAQNPDADFDREPESAGGSEVKNLSELKPGDKVFHRRFGRGVVAFSSDKLITVKFEKYGTQTLGGNFLSSIEVMK